MAIDRLTQLGAVVIRQENKQSWLERLPGVRDHNHAGELYLGSIDCFAYAPATSGYVRLMRKHFKFPNDLGLEELAHLCGLEILKIESRLLDDASVVEIAAAKSLRKVILASPYITRHGLFALSNHPNLKRLELCGTQVSTKDISDFANENPRIEVIAVTIDWDSVEDYEYQHSNRTNHGADDGEVDLFTP